MELGYYASQLYKDVKQCYSLVDDHHSRAQAKYNHAADLPNFFTTGEEVWLYNPVLHVNEPRAFKRYWTGPYVITAIINPMVYKIQSVAKPNKSQVVYASRLKKKF
jgi:hypothetical protein